MHILLYANLQIANLLANTKAYTKFREHHRMRRVTEKHWIGDVSTSPAGERQERVVLLRTTSRIQSETLLSTQCYPARTAGMSSTTISSQYKHWLVVVAQ